MLLWPATSCRLLPHTRWQRVFLAPAALAVLVAGCDDAAGTAAPAADAQASSDAAGHDAATDDTLFEDTAQTGSDAAAMLIGQTLDFDGGYSLKMMA